MVKATRNTGVFPSVGIAQAALETGWGKKIIAGANNAFGIKAMGATTPYWDGSFVEATGWEEGEAPRLMKWRKYRTLDDSVKDYVYLLTQNKLYAAAMTKPTPETQIQAIKDSGYASGANYVRSVVSIINDYDLKSLDVKKKVSE